jgi:hypothetical protein
MSLDFPANVEREIEQYALSEQISPSVAAVKLVQQGLKTKKRNPAKREITEADLETLRKNVPIFAFLEKLPDSVIDGMEAATKQTRAQWFVPRG